MNIGNRALTRRSPDRRGLGLVVVVFMAMVVFASMTVMFTLANSGTALSETHWAKVQSDYLSLAACEHAEAEIQLALRRGKTPPTAGLLEIDGLQATFSVSEESPPAMSMSPDGLSTFTAAYRIEGTATSDGVTRRSRRIVSAEIVPLFQFAMFYENDLVLYPGPSMTIRGRVHANADMYVEPGDPLTLDTNCFRIAGNLFMRRRHESDLSKEPVRIRRWVNDPFDPTEPVEFVDLEPESELTSLGISSVSGFDSDFAGHDANADGDLNDAGDWLPFAARVLELGAPPAGYTGGSGNTLQTEQHGQERLEVPPIADLSSFVEAASDSTEADYVWNSTTQRFDEVTAGTGTHEMGALNADAGLRILTYSDGTWQAFDGLGFDVTTNVSSAVSITSIYDARQAEGSGQSLGVAQLDIAQLVTTGYYPSNGLLYMGAIGSGKGTAARGFEVVNGSELAGNLTLASENSVYVRGDFNTVNKRSAAVIADAVNLLSNSWDGSKSSGSLPEASDTTYNLAILTGNTDFAPGDYCGGANNLPRFHEDWDDKTCTITGSLVCAMLSQHADSPWIDGGDSYSPPDRIWSYDESFNDFNSLPPYAPRAVEIQRIASM